MTIREIDAGRVAFQPRARLLKLIGAELISDEVLAITELVKNAHDADANAVSIVFRGVTGSDGEIVIRDDGCGMGLDGVLGRWMQPAGSSKTGTDRRLTPRGRRVLGEKGVGRFAADKLARTLELVTRQAGAPREVRACFDWDEFDDEARLLADVHSHWEHRPACEISESGTILRMRGLRKEWTERSFRRLCTRLSRLRSPFRDSGAFAIHIDSDEFPEYSGELRADFLERAPYRIDATFDGEQTIALAINGETATQHLWNGNGELRCGPVRARIFAFDLETEAIARLGPRLDVRAWLREWSGISVYRDNFRVWPYGEPHDDWLRLDQRRVNNPVVRLSNNQVVGFIDITRDGNPHLVDQTNREGFINNAALEDLRRLMYFVLQTLEAERQAVRHPKAPRATGRRASPTTTDPVADELDAIAARLDPGTASAVRRLATKTRETTERRQQQQQWLLDGFADLAAAGQSSTLLVSVVSPILDSLRQHCRELRRGGVPKNDRLGSVLRDIESDVQAVGARLAMVAPVDGPVTQRRRTIDVDAELGVFRTIVEPLLDAHRAVLETEVAVAGVYRIEMRPEVFRRLLLMLTMNSLEWVPTRRRPVLKVVLRGDDERCEMIFSDNGPGIPSQHAERVFEPLFSTKEDGRGMGLAIVRSIMTAHGGTIEVIVDRRRRGANLRLCWPRKRSRATMNTW